MLKNKKIILILLSAAVLLFVIFLYKKDVIFEEDNPLQVNSEPREIDLVDYEPEGQFILHGDYIYYAGNEGAVYKYSIWL
ncbi:MAG: hypothetical protein WBJ13_02435 [Sedimentibacter sp.]